MTALQAVSTNNTLKIGIWFAVILLVLACVTLVFQSLLVPLLVSFTLYALFAPVYAYLLRKGLTENLSALAVIAIIFLVLVFIIFTLSAPVEKQLQLLVERFPVILASLESTGIAFLDKLNITVENGAIISFINSSHLQAGELALTTGSNLIVTFVTICVLVPLITFFLLKDYRRFRNLMLSKLPNASYELGWIIYYRVVDKLQHYIRGIIMQSFVITIICSTGFFIVGFESYILLGVLAGVFNIIPYVGPLLALILPVLIVISELPMDLVMLLMAVGVVLLAQLVDNLFVIPLVIASSVNLHPLVVILGLIIFGSFFGLIGMVLAVPVMVTANIIYTGLQSGLHVKHEGQTP